MNYKYYSTLINYKNSTIMSSEKTTEALYKQMEEIENGRESASVVFSDDIIVEFL